jgi:hypothetical protein
MFDDNLLRSGKNLGLGARHGRHLPSRQHGLKQTGKSFRPHFIQCLKHCLNSGVKRLYSDAPVETRSFLPSLVSICHRVPNNDPKLSGFSA